LNNVNTVLALASTLIASIALFGVMIGLFIQIRQLRALNLQTARTTHADLLRTAIDYLVLRLYPRFQSMDPDDFRTEIYLNWLTMHFQTMFLAGLMSAASLRMQMRTLFQVETTRTWWAWAHEYYEAAASTNRYRRFVSLVNDEYRAAVRGGLKTYRKSSPTGSTREHTGGQEPGE
jgi:Family of unknown function (DUF6082)